MLQSLMKGTKKEDFQRDMEIDRPIILSKCAEDLCESIEIMMVETRMLGAGRACLRGALCMLRGEPTNVPPLMALHVLGVLEQRWKAQEWEQRALIVQRAYEIVKALNTATEPAGGKNAQQ
jgi:hypothetical protein